MRPALLLVDLQQDFLQRPGLEPGADTIVQKAAELLGAFRAAGKPVFHCVTQVRRDGADRMPHWKENDTRICTEGTSGAQAPTELAPLATEGVFPKAFHSAFDNVELCAELRTAGVDTLVIAGIYTHACVRTTAIDGYRHGFTVQIVRDAVGSTEPDHAKTSLEYLEGRIATLVDVAAVRASMKSAPATTNRSTWTHRNPVDWDEILDEVPVAGAAEVADAVARASASAPAWARLPLAQRKEKLQQFVKALEARREQAVSLIVREVAKPVALANDEFDYALSLAKHALENAGAAQTEETPNSFEVRQHPLGVVAAITPWNNPLAIPVGKFTPALLCGNTVVWKPALQSPRLAALLMDLANDAELADVLHLASGDAETGRAIAWNSDVAAITFTGSINAGRQVAAACAHHLRPLQAELGGNNAVLVMDDADSVATATQLAEAVFSFSGQRCTAPRRLIVHEAIVEPFARALVEATQALRIGHPKDQLTQLGPVISRDKQESLRESVEKARAGGARVLCGGGIPVDLDPGLKRGCWVAPTLVADPDPGSNVVLEESFGPIAVIQSAPDLDTALKWCNAVPQGLVATLFSGEKATQERFLAEAQAGILALNQAPVPVDPAAPFGGWKNSGFGPPEHGRWDPEFQTRIQAVYRDPGVATKS